MRNRASLMMRNGLVGYYAFHLPAEAKLRFTVRQAR